MTVYCLWDVVGLKAGHIEVGASIVGSLTYIDRFCPNATFLML
jgi:hypothetical protein